MKLWKPNGPILFGDLDKCVQAAQGILTGIATELQGPEMISTYWNSETFPETLHLLVTFSDSMLLDYLLRPRNFPQYQLPEPVCVPSESRRTAAFDPQVKLRLDYIPYMVTQFNPIDHIQQHLVQLLPEFIVRFKKFGQPLDAELRSLVSTYQKRKLSNESSVGIYASRIIDVTTAAYEELTGQNIDSPTETVSLSNAVYTDYAICISSGSTVVLWENKSPSVYICNIEQLTTKITEGPYTFDLNKTRWDGWEGILSKLAYHACSLERLRWAVVYCGTQFMIIYIRYIKDQGGLLRPVLYCSVSYSTLKSVVPLPALALYMAMTEGISTIEIEHALRLGPFRTEIPPIPSPPSSVSRRHISSLDDLVSPFFILYTMLTSL
ncbi:hypothetical protein FRC15_011969 [Serendipita sp. 397]|nr:hypothetical protein FRC15_011969 [Serendipita sp. 397]